MHVLNVILIMLITLFIAYTTRDLQKENRFIPALMLGAAALIFTMAMITIYPDTVPSSASKRYVHPDERVHMVAAEYYRHHYLPPPIESEQIASTFSIYGKTRLASRELYYPMVGYLSRLLEPLKNALSTDIRLITLWFFVMMTIMAAALPGFRPIAAPLLISPQVWYLYSYANSDGFALFVATVAAYQAACNTSTLNKLLTEDKPKWLWFHALWL